MANPLEGLNAEQIAARLKAAGVTREVFDHDWLVREAMMGSGPFPTTPDPRTGEPHKYAGKTLDEAREWEQAQVVVPTTGPLVAPTTAPVVAGKKKDAGVKEG